MNRMENRRTELEKKISVQLNTSNELKQTVWNCIQVYNGILMKFLDITTPEKADTNCVSLPNHFISLVDFEKKYFVSSSLCSLYLKRFGPVPPTVAVKIPKGKLNRWYIDEKKFILWGMRNALKHNAISTHRTFQRIHYAYKLENKNNKDLSDENESVDDNE